MSRLVPLLLALAAAACSSLATDWDYDPEVDFSGLRAYAWMEPPDDHPVDELSHRRVRRSADEVLGAAGYRLDPAAPDFLLVAHLGTETKLRVTDWGYGYRRGYGGFGGRQVDVDEYEVGTLVLDVVLPVERALVWRGTASGTLYRDASPEKREERIHAAVTELLASFPPPAD